MHQSKENYSYKKGMLLGLTMAEIIILIIFLLMLSFAALLDEEKRKNEVFTEYSEEFKKVLVVLSQADESLKKEIVQLVTKAPDIQKFILENNLNQDEENTTDVIGAALNLYDKEINKNTVGESELSLQDRLDKALEKNQAYADELNNIKDQKSALIQSMKQSGKGFDWPPCWANANGKPEYIYNIDLISSGIIIKNTNVPHREKEKARLPVDNIELNKAISVERFRNQTNPLFNWSKQRECRFYVIVNDKTGPTEKHRYKQLLQAVEGKFYIYKSRKSYAGRSTKPAPKEKIQTVSEQEEKTLFNKIFGEAPDSKKPQKIRGNFNN